MHHRTIQINHQPDATIFQFIILTFVYSSTCFGRYSAHHQELNDCSGSLWFYLRIVVIVVLCSWSGRPARPRTQFLHLLYGKDQRNPMQSSDLITSQYILAPFATKLVERHHLFSVRLFAFFHLLACKNSNLSTRLPSR